MSTLNSIPAPDDWDLPGWDHLSPEAQDMAARIDKVLEGHWDALSETYEDCPECDIDKADITFSIALSCETDEYAMPLLEEARTLLGHGC